MKQLLQRFDTGERVLADVPIPAISRNTVIVQTVASLISSGTERMLVDFGQASLLQKARQQPDRVRQVLDKVKAEGLKATYDAVRDKLAMPVPLGYCQVGYVVEAGQNAARVFSVGDLVATNGPHAEFVRVPLTLAARVPAGVSPTSAAFTPLAAIALQGIRLANPTLGETVVVVGLGLVGLMTVQLLIANGCDVIGVDPSADRRALAATFGAHPVDPTASLVVDEVLARTGGVGADAVLLTLASASSGPIDDATKMSRKKGRLVLVGVTGLELKREEFFKKELTFAVSCSYGPGRYDPSYEDEARDYPLAYVRWTEQRNFEAVLRQMQRGALTPEAFVSHRFNFSDVESAYQLLSGTEASLGVLLEYPVRPLGVPTPADRTVAVRSSVPRTSGNVGVIGAGGYGMRFLLPAMKKAGFGVRTVVTNSSLSSAAAADRFGAEFASTDADQLFLDDGIDTVFVLTRHNSHVALASRALRAGKHVFVEKPLALTQAELDELEAAARQSDRLLTAGFNRRFAPISVQAKQLLKGRAGPVSIVANINAGLIPQDHWTQDPAVGGGRIVGEAIHWIDLSRFLVGNPIVAMHVTVGTVGGRVADDIAHVSMRFADGSTAAINYISTGAAAFPKERIECHFDGKTLVVDNWRRLERFGFAAPSMARTGKSDKGQENELRAWRTAVTESGIAPIPLDELFEIARWTIAASEVARTGGGVVDAGVLQPT